jgi:hypothetical protein
LDFRTAAELPESEAFAANHFVAPASVEIEDLKILANQRDVPYQSLLKVFLAERLERERRRV